MGLDTNTFAFVLSRALVMRFTNTDFNKFFFKVKSYNIIYTFINYFITIFTIFNNYPYHLQLITTIIRYTNSQATSVQLQTSVIKSGSAFCFQAVNKKSSSPTMFPCVFRLLTRSHPLQLTKELPANNSVHGNVFLVMI